MQRVTNVRRRVASQVFASLNLPKRLTLACFVFCLCAIHKTRYYLTRVSLVAQIANTEESALVDAGSSMSFINENTARRILQLSHVLIILMHLLRFPEMCEDML